MFTPQEIQEKTFERAVFGGYDMKTVDEFLEPLTQDYITLYKENAVLKSKMRVLVEKLEEYRTQEESMRKAMVSAQRNADAVVAEAQRKAAQIVSDAQTLHIPDAEAVIAEETERMNCAKETALSFIRLVEKDIKAHLDLLENLKTRDMSLEIAPKAEKKPFDFDGGDKPLVVPTVSETPAQIADEISQNLSQSHIMDLEEPAPQPAPVQVTPPPMTTGPQAVTQNTIRFTNLQFGSSYDPTR